MTFETPINLGQMRTALQEMTQLDVNDPRNNPTTLNRFLNAAMHRFQISNPNGWPWDFIESGGALTAGQHVFDFQLGGGVGFFPLKCRYVILQDANGAWEYPLERVTRADQLSRYPKDNETGAPKCYTILGKDGAVGNEPVMRMEFRPAADVAYNFVTGFQAPLQDMVADADPDASLGGDDFGVDMWSSSVLDYAAFLLYRSRDDLAEALLGAKADFDSGVLQMRRTVRNVVGPGIPMRPLADDRELQ